MHIEEHLHEIEGTVSGRLLFNQKIHFHFRLICPQEKRGHETGLVAAADSSLSEKNIFLLQVSLLREKPGCVSMYSSLTQNVHLTPMQTEKCMSVRKTGPVLVDCFLIQNSHFVPRLVCPG